MADTFRGLRPVIPHVDVGDLTELAVSHNLAGPLDMIQRTPLRTGLDHAVVLACGLDHLARFIDDAGDRLLDVDILAGFASLDHNVGMPVVGCGDAHHVHGFVGENLAEVLDGLWRMALFPSRGGRPLEVWLVDVTNRNNLEVGLPHRVIHIRTSSFAHADKRSGNSVVRSLYVASKDRSGKCSACADQEFPTICRHMFRFSFTQWGGPPGLPSRRRRALRAGQARRPTPLSVQIRSAP